MKKKLFGEAAVEKGYITAEQLAQGLGDQERARREQRASRFLGEILVELGYMTEKQVLDVLSAVHDHHTAV